MDPDPRRRQKSVSKLLLDLIDASEHIQPEPGPAPAQQLLAFVARNVTRAASIGAVAALVFLVLGFFNWFTYSFALGLDSSFMSRGRSTGCAGA